MKILLVITRSELGGAQTVVTQLANELVKHHDVVLVAGEGDGKMWDTISKDVIREECPQLRRAISPLHDAIAALKLRKIYKKYKPDIIHLHSSKAGILGRLVFPRRKVVYTVHGFDSIRKAFRKFLPIERQLQRRCKAIVAVSRYDEINLIEEGITKGVSTVYNGINRPNTDGISVPDVFKKYSKVILSIARISPQKNPKLFIDTARLLPQYGFIWIGNQSEVSELGEIPANCHFLGNIVNAGAYCSWADIFMLPSHYEGLPMVIIEAMSFGKPIIASNVGGVSEIVRNNINGYALDNDARMFAEKIDTILKDEQLYNTMAKSSLEIYEKELTVDKMVAGYLNVYNRE